MDFASFWWSIITSSALNQSGNRNNSARYPRSPLTVALPLVGRTSPQTIFTNVDLPAPLGPSRPTSSPSPTLRSIPFSASVVP